MKFLAVMTLIGAAALQSIASTDHVSPPDFITKNNKILSPDRIEWRSGDTLAVTFKARYTPKWWISIDSTATLVNPTDNKVYQPSRIEGMSFGERFYMPESGEHEFTLLYAGIPRHVKEVDFIEQTWKIYGLRLDGTPAEKPEKVDREKWIREHATEYPGVPDKIFDHGEVAINGRISGYSPRLGLKNILFYITTPIKSTPISATVADDGTFSLTAPIEMASHNGFFEFGDGWNKLYLEPNRKLDVLIDWDTYVESGIADAITYGGELGRINNDLINAPKIKTGYNQSLGDTAVPSVAQQTILANLPQMRQKVREFIDSNNLHPHSRRLIENNLELEYAIYLLLYDQDRRYNRYFKKEAESLKEPITIEFYEPIRGILRDDPWLAASNGMSQAVNYLAFSDLTKTLGYEDESLFVVTKTPAYAYADSIGITFSDEVEKNRQWIRDHMGDSLWVPQSKVQEMIIDREHSVVDALNNSDHAEDFNKYLDRVLSSLSSPDFSELEDAHNIANSNRVLREYAGIDTQTALLQLLTIGDLTNFGHYYFATRDQAGTDRMVKTVEEKGMVTDSLLLASLRDYFATGFEKVKGYDLPDSDAGNLMREILKPYAGKFVLVDFWATTCGPCRANIQNQTELRNRNANNPNFKFLFITSESESPRQSYDKYVEQHLKNVPTLRLNDGDHNLLKGLFKFSGIPRYVLIGPKGQVLDDDFNVHYDMNKQLKKYIDDRILF